MIYSINNYKMILFPLTTQTKGKNYVFKAYKYPNIGLDRKLNPNIVIDYTYNIDKIIDKIFEEDFINSMVGVCKYLIVYSNDKNRFEIIQDIIGIPKIHNIIKVLKKQINEKHSFNYYLILDIDKNKGYKVIELNEEQNTVIGKITYLNQDVLPNKITELDQLSLNNLLSQIIDEKEDNDNSICNDNIKIEDNNYISKYDLIKIELENDIKYGFVLAVSNTRYAICIVDPFNHEILSEEIILKINNKPKCVYKLNLEEIEIYKKELSKTYMDSEKILKNKN